MKYKVEVIADSSGKFVGNKLEFDTVDQAQGYAENLANRWSSVLAWRVVPVGGGDAIVELEY